MIANLPQGLFGNWSTELFPLGVKHAGLDWPYMKSSKCRRSVGLKVIFVI